MKSLLWFNRQKEVLKKPDTKMNRKKLEIAELFTSIPIETQIGCSPLLRQSRVCVCMDCRRLGGCQVEKLSNKIRDDQGNCIRCIRACSLKANDRGDKPVCADFILEEFNDMITSKYLGR